MKKIIAVVLAVVCTFALFSCGEDKVFDNMDTKFAASVPTRIVTTTTQVIGSTTLNGSYELKTGSVDGKIATVATYSYDEFNKIDEGTSEEITGVIKTVTGSKEFYAGKGIRINGGSWTDGYNFAPTAGSIDIELTSKNVLEYSYENNTFTCKVSKEKAVEVLGIDVAPSADVNVVITDNGAEITSVTIEYTVVDADENYPDTVVKIVTEYYYGLQEVTFVK